MKRYPLVWPTGWKRTPATVRRRAKFSKQQYHASSIPGNSGLTSKGEVTIAEGTKRVLVELDRLGVTDEAIISTNLNLRVDGLPKSDQRAPEDPGVAVYWKLCRDKAHKVMAVDQYDRVADNLAAIAATLEAMRAIERHGGAAILERAFTGFEALPAPGTQHRSWRAVMGFDPNEIVTQDTLTERYRHLTKTRHPDTSTGSHDAMTELNGAYAHAQRALSL